MAKTARKQTKKKRKTNTHKAIHTGERSNTTPCGNQGSPQPGSPRSHGVRWGMLHDVPGSLVHEWCLTEVQIVGFIGLTVLGMISIVSRQLTNMGDMAAEEARTCEAWFQLTFRPQKWNLKAHMWHQLSPFPSSNAAIAMQHHPGNIHQSVATPATPWYVLIQLPSVIDTISKRWRSKRAFNTSPSHIFP